MTATALVASARARPAVAGWYAVPQPVEHAVRRDGAMERRVEWLPFTVRVAHGPQDWQKAAAIRHAAYSRHLPPSVTEALRQPEPMDQAPGVAVLLAESKVDGSLLGTLRVQTNAHQPLALEQSFALPDWMAGARCAEVTRLAMAQMEHSRVVKTVMLKAAFYWCQQQGVRFVLVTARAPLDRQYARLMFRDVYPELGFVPLPHVFNLPHRVMYNDIATARDDGAEHPLYDFWFNTDHPDIVLD
ncbi:hypothetical protein Tther_01256 [Tepidimonas thermarum]|uniref:N-acyl amino acid synthase FeeM catalytic core domain-containing protein n=1 Tax=Tepidimonas thermarum TaxID=335431 RepID=A0A554X224_9BURK|nr:hypothetical protein [Tepidimonas thermarum]TSE29845.1 hypothetical protein Tther_01256 [Tepidimonas thermarum]